jgi:peptidyl-prolyl cis-trans isomerase D
MMKFLRSQSQTVLIVILGFLGLGFFFYGNSGNFLSSGSGGPTDFGRIDGEDLSVADLYGAVRSERTAELLNPSEQPPSQTQTAQNAWTRLLLLHEAAKLHIDVPDDPKVADAQLGAYIQALPEFQQNGAYDPKRLTMLLQYVHVSFDTYASLMQDQMRIEAVYHALFSSLRGLAADVDAQYGKEYGPVQVSYVSFPLASYVASAKVTPAEIEAAYKADPMNTAYRTDEQRQVEYVLFPLTPDQAKLPAKAKDPAIQALGEKALDFALALQPDPEASASAATTPPAADFQAEAKKRGLTPVTTNLFPVGTPPAGLAPSPAFNNAAFALTTEDPVSKVVPLDNGVVVMHLVKIQPSELKPLAGVTPAIEKQLQQAKGEEAQHAAATLSAAVLKATVAKSGDFKAAAAAQHLAVQTVPAFIPHDAPENDQRLEALAYFSTQLAVGQVSQPVPIETDNSVIVLHIDSRAAADPAGLGAFEKTYRDRQDEQLRAAALSDWVEWMSRRPGTHKPPHLEAYGGVGE